MVLTAVLLLGALSFLPPQATAQAGTSSLDGRICNLDHPVYYIQKPQEGDAAGCGEGLPGASLHLSKPGVLGTQAGAVDKTATSGSDGVYGFSQLPDGDYTLAVTRTGFEPVKLTVTVQGATSRDVGLKPQTVAVTGKAVGPDAQGIANAHVTACCWDAGSSDTRTGSDGTFALSVPSGTRTFTVGEAPGFQDLQDVRFVDGSQAITLTLAKVPPQDATVQGTVKDQDGNPVAGLQVNVYSYPSQPQPMPYETGAPAKGGSSPGGTGATAPYSYPYYNGGSNYTTTDAAGRYSIHVFGGSSVSLNIYREGYASFYQSFEVAHGQTKTVDVQLLKYPAKTAHIEGRVVDAATGKGIAFVGLSAQSPLYGLYECSSDSSTPNTYGGTATAQSPPAGYATSDAIVAYPVNPGCAIRVNSDGTFAGNVTPGYTILQASFQPYRACPESQDSDGSSRRECGPDYYPWTQVLQLPKDATTPVTVKLERRPAPDAVVAGYLVDQATGKAIPGAHVSFSNLDGYGYAYATTDADGSYKLRMRSGHLEVYAYADGYLHWAGTLTVKAGETPFDIGMTAGHESNGGCCPIAYATGATLDSKAMGAPASGYSSSGTATGSPGGMGVQSSLGGSSTANEFQDLGGGLGPYDAAARAKLLSNAGGGQASPHVEAVVLLGMLAAMAWVRRRS
jgi:hypothetical protein